MADPKIVVEEKYKKVPFEFEKIQAKYFQRRPEKGAFDRKVQWVYLGYSLYPLEGTGENSFFVSFDLEKGPQIMHSFQEVVEYLGMSEDEVVQLIAEVRVLEAQSRLKEDLLKSMDSVVMSDEYYFVRKLGVFLESLLTRY